MGRGRRKTPKVIRDAKKQYYIEHREERLAYSNEYYQKNREEILKKLRERRKNDPKYAEKQRAYHRRYYQKNKKRTLKTRK